MPSSAKTTNFASKLSKVPSNLQKCNLDEIAGPTQLDANSHNQHKWQGYACNDLKVLGSISACALEIQNEFQ